MSKATILVRFRVHGFHRWPGAADHRGREYLADRHRHLFHVEVCMEVHHDDRDVEFHDLLDECRRMFPGGEMGAKSCEHMARELVLGLVSRYGRPVTASVFEDGEVGALVRSYHYDNPDHEISLQGAHP